MSAKKQSKREKKIDTVMGEFKEGSLKSGGSGKKVTNPKQAIAIALSEANAMNQGGMMYNEIMNRPMFQTPQMRQGGGIMAGVAPIRGYAEGDLVEEDDFGFMDYVRVAPEILRDMVVGDDGTMEDFFTTEKTAEGQGLNVRDLTDFFIVDPDDPVDVGIATATAGLMASGVGAPGAIAAQLGRMGYKGKKVADAVEKAVRLGVGDSRVKTFGRGQTARILLPGEAYAAEADQSMGGIASLPVEEVQVSVENPVTVEEIEGLGISAEEFSALDPQIKQQYLDLLNDRRMAANVGYNVGAGVGGIADVITAPARLLGEAGEYVADSRFGRLVGLSEPGDVDEPFEMYPMSESMREGARRNAPATMSQLSEGFQPSAPPTPPEAPATAMLEEEDLYAGVTPESQAFVEQSTEAPSRSPNILQRIGGALTGISEGIGSERDLIRMGQSTGERRSGRPIRNLALERFEAGQAYDKALQDRDIAERTMVVGERGTALEQQLDMLAERGIGKDDTERLNLLLSKGIDEEDIANIKLTLFQDAAKMVADGALKQDDVSSYVQQQLGQIILSGVATPASTEQTTALSQEEAERLAQS
tara:strand:+ start:9478 stop:11244 length:1767 start_codon:yes stop_codon:yes gene_type:complete